MSRNAHHFVFAPKWRRPILTPDIMAEVTKHVKRICELKDIELLAINTDPEKPDHIHIMASLPQSMSPAKAMHVIKGYSSTYTRRKYPHFKWQRRYWSGSIGSGMKRVKQYVNEQ